MEPTTLTAAAIATMIATKAFEKTGEKIGDAVGGLIPKFLGALRCKDPKTADAIATVAQQPGLAEQQPEVYSTSALVAQVEAIAQDDAEIRQAAQEIQTAIQAQPGAIINLTKLADKIVSVNQGRIDTQNINISSF